MKTCSTCKIKKSLEEFYKHKKTKDELCYSCKECMKQNNKKYDYSMSKKCLGCDKIIKNTAIRCHPCVGKQKSIQAQGNKIKHSQGYILIFQPNHPNADKKGYIMEHRLVIEKMLGRYLYPNENIHHKNGVKNDNREENLELWVISQPSGQRIENLIQHHLEFMTIYKKEIAQYKKFIVERKDFCK